MSSRGYRLWIVGGWIEEAHIFVVSVHSTRRTEERRNRKVGVILRPSTIILGNFKEITLVVCRSDHDVRRKLGVKRVQDDVVRIATTFLENALEMASDKQQAKLKLSNSRIRHLALE